MDTMVIMQASWESTHSNPYIVIAFTKTDSLDFIMIDILYDQSTVNLIRIVGSMDEQEVLPLSADFL